MKLINKTKWDSEHLRKLAKETLKRRGGKNNTVIRIISSKGRYSGYATINGFRITMRVPITTEKSFRSANRGGIIRFDKPREFNSITFAQVFIHEIDHTLGLGHKEMVKVSDINCNWAKKYKVLPKKVVKKPKIDLKKQRYEKILKKIREKKRTIKRNKTLLKKYQKKKNYYEKKYGYEVS